MLLVPDLGEIARDLEQHPLMRRDLARAFLADPFVEMTDRRAQGAGCCCVSPSMMRRSRMRAPTWSSIAAVDRPLFGLAMPSPVQVYHKR